MEMVTVRMLIPEEMRDQDFKVLNVSDGNGSMVEYERDGDYVVIRTANLDQFAFVYREIDLTWLIVLLSVLLAAAIAFLVFLIIKWNKSKEDDNGKKKPIRTYSFLPIFLLAAVSYKPGQIPAVIVLAVLLGLALVAIGVVLFLRKKNQGEKKQETSIEKEQQSVESKETTGNVAETSVSPAPEVEPVVPQEPVAPQEPVENPVAEIETVALDEEEEEGIVILDTKGRYFNIRYNRSFTAKLIQSSDEAKAYYSELKNEALSYDKAKSLVNWTCDSINVGKAPIVKFDVSGKTLCAFFPLNAEDLEEKYKVEKIESAKYAATPCMYRINNEGRLRYAKELIEKVCVSRGLTKNATKNEDFYLPSETTEALIAKGLIKEVASPATEAQIEHAKKAGTVRTVKRS